MSRRKPSKRGARNYVCLCIGLAHL